jgi:hypothetical protein
MKKSNFTTAIRALVPFAVSLAASGSAGAAMTYDLTNCFASTATAIAASKELTVLNINIKGIARSTPAKEPFDNSTYQCGLTLRIAGAERSGTGFCKFMDVDGDYIVGEMTPNNPTGGAWKFLVGTGKWKGITGGGKYTQVTRGKPIVPGTAQGCSRATGTYELKK